MQYGVQDLSLEKFLCIRKMLLCCHKNYVSLPKRFEASRKMLSYLGGLSYISMTLRETSLYDDYVLTLLRFRKLLELQSNHHGIVRGEPGHAECKCEVEKNQTSQPPEKI